MPRLWSATLNPSGPNYEGWFDIFGHNPVPLISPYPQVEEFGIEGQVECYLVNTGAMVLQQRARLLTRVADKLKVPVYEISKEAARAGFPIRAVDVVVSYDMRAFA